MSSVTVTVTVQHPVWVVVPVRRPLGESVKPGQSVAVARVNVAVPIAPVCVNCAENGTPAVPVALVARMTVIVWQKHSVY